MLVKYLIFLSKGIVAGPKQGKRMIIRLVGSIWAFALLFNVCNILRLTIWDGYPFR